MCELYVGGDEAQVESVTTLEEFGGGGVGSAIVLAAEDEGREDLTDAEDGEFRSLTDEIKTVDEEIIAREHGAERAAGQGLPSEPVQRWRNTPLEHAIDTELRSKLDEAISLRERAYSAYTGAGDARGSARMALLLAWDNEGRGAYAIANGWLANAERILADAAPFLPKGA